MIRMNKFKVINIYVYNVEILTMVDLQFLVRAIPLYQSWTPYNLIIRC